MTPSTSKARYLRLRQVRAIAREALVQYPFAGARATFLGHSENVTYRIDVPGSEGGGSERYLLRVHAAHTDEIHSRLTHTLSAIDAELRWLQALHAETGLAVPLPVLNRRGERVTEATAKEGSAPLCCSVTRWVEGRRGSIATPRMAARVGAVLAAIHCHSEAVDEKPYAARPHWTWEITRNTLGPLQEWVGAPFLTAEHHGVLEAAAERVAQLMSHLGTAKPEYGLIHGDLHSGNLVFHRSEPRAIDFSRCGFAHYTYDLAACCMYLPPERRTVFLKGYQEVRPLPASFAEQVEAFIMRGWLENIAFHAPDPREHEWLGQLIPYLTERMQTHFLAGRPFLFGG